MNTNNPYSPPQSNVKMSLNKDTANDLQLLDEPRKVSVSDSLNWISEGWQLIKPDLGMWVLLMIVLFLINIAFNFIPVVGGLAGQLLAPVFGGGLMMALAATQYGERLVFNDLFRGFKDGFGPLLGLGALTIGVSLVFMLLLGGIMFMVWGSNLFMMENMEASEPMAAVSGFSIFITVAVSLLALVFLSMLFWFTTQLVALNGVPVFESLGRSLKGALKNWLPLLVFWLIMVLLLIAGAIPFFLGLLIVVPILYGTLYASYKDIYLS